MNLAYTTELTQVDQNDDELLFDARLIYADTLNMTKKQYSDMEKEMSAYLITIPGAHIYVWNDVSGYKYWIKQQEEYNYIQITARVLDKDTVNMDDVTTKVNEAYTYFFNKYSI